MTDSNPLYQVLDWIDRDFKFANSEENVIVEKDENWPGKGRIFLYTTEHKYVISVSYDYLGCILDCRKPNPGEDHTRGSDLADGVFSKETWYSILADIVSCELVSID